MSRILAIFRKDARRLWSQAAAFSFLILTAAALDPTYRGRAAESYDLLFSLALPLACSLLIVSAIHEEKLPGYTQYWITRPYGWKELLAAKALFIAAFVNLPVLAYHAGVYTALGVGASDQLRALFFRQVFFTAVFVLPAAVLAALTRNLSRAVLIALAIVVGLAAVDLGGIALRRGPLLLSWDRADVTLRTALIASGSVAVLLAQYSRRGTALGMRIAAVAGLLVALACSSYAPARAAKLAAEGTAALTLDADPSRRSTTPPASDPDVALFDMPVRLGGAPSGVALNPQYFSVSLKTPRGPWGTWQAQLHNLEGDRGWLMFSAPRASVSRVQDEPVDVLGSFELSLFDELRSSPLPNRRTVTVPKVGGCRDVEDPEGGVSFECFSPSPLAVAMVGVPGVRANSIVSPRSVEKFPSAAGFRPLTRFTSLVSYPNRDAMGNIRLISGHELPPVRVTLRLQSVQLRDYWRAPR